MQITRNDDDTFTLTEVSRWELRTMADSAMAWATIDPQIVLAQALAEPFQATQEHG